MDIDYLLERLEEAITSGSRVPFSRRSLVDEEECLAIIEQIRDAVPDEIQRARRTNQDRDQVLSEAQEQVRLMLQRAREEAELLVAEHAVVRAAELRGQQIRDEALQVAEQTRREADEYAYGALERLDQTLSQTLQVVRRGLRELELGDADALSNPNQELA